MLSISIDNDSPVPKFRQLADQIMIAVKNRSLIAGDALPSVNQIIESSALSRDTVVKAYNLLKKKGLIDAIPQKGYFVKGNSGSILFFIDTFKAYKEVLYHSFYDNLPEGYQLDLQFHHYDIHHFEDVITNSIGKYAKYVVMGFNHPRVKEILALCEPDKLLVIDWNVNSPENCSQLIQDFGQSMYDALESGWESIEWYEHLVYIYPDYTYHPSVSIDYFKRFCLDHKIKHSIITDPKKFEVQKGYCYLTVSDRMLVKIIDKANSNSLKIGEDIGLISYNETPMKKYVHQGITVISTDFEEMGKLAAQFVAGNDKMQITVPTKFIKRHSV